MGGGHGIILSERPFQHVKLCRYNFKVYNTASLLKFQGDGKMENTAGKGWRCFPSCDFFCISLLFFFAMGPISLAVCPARKRSGCSPHITRPLRHAGKNTHGTDITLVKASKTGHRRRNCGVQGICQYPGQQRGQVPLAPPYRRIPLKLGEAQVGQGVSVGGEDHLLPLGEDGPLLRFYFFTLSYSPHIFQTLMRHFTTNPATKLTRPTAQQ